MLCAGTGTVAVLWTVADFVPIVPDAALDALGLVYVLLLLLAMRWLYDARAGVEGLPGAALRWRRGWTVGAWFVPVVGLFIGAAVVADIAGNSVPDADAAARRRLVRASWAWCAAMTGTIVVPPIALLAWWAGAGTVAYTTLYIVATLLFLLSAGLFITVARAVTRNLDPARFQVPAPPAAAPPAVRLTRS